MPVASDGISGSLSPYLSSRQQSDPPRLKTALNSLLWNLASNTAPGLEEEAKSKE